MLSSQDLLSNEGSTGSKTLIAQQLDFVKLCGQDRYNLLQLYTGLKRGGHSKVKAHLAMALGLIKEEAIKEVGAVQEELLSAQQGPLTDSEWEDYIIEKLVEAGDGAIDTIVVCAGFLNVLGFPGNALWDIVQEANMAKGVPCVECNGTGAGNLEPCGVCEGLGVVVERRRDGKILKPAGWESPNPKIKKLLLQTLFNLVSSGASDDPNRPESGTARTA